MTAATAALAIGDIRTHRQPGAMIAESTAVLSIVGPAVRVLPAAVAAILYGRASPRPDSADAPAGHAYHALHHIS